MACSSLRCIAFACKQVIGGKLVSNEIREQIPDNVDSFSPCCLKDPCRPGAKQAVEDCQYAVPEKEGHVVAVTGDGTNDAALREADIGLSMGVQGTEVAKESSDIVILDDNFASVATVLRWGRCVYNNIQKFIQFQLTVNVAALAFNFVAAVSAGEVPLTVQLMGESHNGYIRALALATENPTKELMKKKPVGRNEPLITNVMWRNLLAQALYQISVLLTLHFKGEDIFHVTKKVNETLIFNTFVLCQVFNEFNARKMEKKNVFEGIHKNKEAELEAMGSLYSHFSCIWPIGFLVKFIPVPEDHGLVISS
ncbi:putative calcium-transporting ATPase 13, plasma membrane-type [Sesamum angolense]|uniref:P-type Ca(2+) transporter n=1 Tax=Sesamum angolense TaxID=2727404 RepID=A0AAE2C1P0_9LAMI|nr:putative calcium-transporting ATPase 13, plasma membrane-type [Sesamum angolense]